MKLTQTLLSALLAGITLNTAVSCTKDKDMTDPKTQEKNKKEKEQKPVIPFNCPACGMG